MPTLYFAIGDRLNEIFKSVRRRHFLPMKVGVERDKKATTGNAVLHSMLFHREKRFRYVSWVYMSGSIAQTNGQKVGQGG